MALIDAKNKAINAKLVYYGPGLCGKTTNLQYVNSKLVNGQELMSLATEGDRTIFFDFMPLDMGTIRGMSVKFKLYTVPGQVRYNQTRKMVLKNVDGVVFVADSQREMLDPNLESLDNLFENLGQLGIDPSTIPLVLQYNKRDLPNAMSAEELDRHLNEKGYRTFEASAVTGMGVVETLKAACVEVIKQLSRHFGETAEATSVQARPAIAVGQAHAGAAVGGVRAAATRSDGSGGGPETGSRRKVGPQWISGMQPGRADNASGDGRRPGAEPSKDDPGAVAKIEGKLDAMQQALTRAVERAAPPADTVRQLRTALDRVRAELESSSHLHAQLKQALPGPGEFTGLRSQLIEVSEKFKRLEGEVIPIVEDLASLGKSVRALPSKADLDAMLAKAASTNAPRANGGGGGPSLSLDDVAKATRRGVDEVLLPTTKRLDSLPTKADLQGLSEAVAPIRSLPTKSDLTALGKALASKLSTAGGNGGNGGAAAVSADVARSLEQTMTGLIESRFAALEEHLEKAAARHAERAAREAAASVEKSHGALLQRLETLVGELRAGASAPAATDREADGEPPAEAQEPPPEQPRAEEPKPDAEQSEPAEAAAASEEPPPEQDGEPAEAAAASEESESEQRSEPTEAAAAPEESGSDAEDGAPDAGSASEEEVSEEAEASAAEESEGDGATAAPEEPASDADEGAPKADEGGAKKEARDEDLADDPQHKNAARIARVMMADLYLYHRDEVEEGLRNDDFFERNKEALEDMRATYESRVPEEVRAEKDHLDAAIEAFLDKKRGQLGLQ